MHQKIKNLLAQLGLLDLAHSVRSLLRSLLRLAIHLRLLLHPITSFITNPVRLVQTLWNCRVLMKGNWDHYSHFAAQPGINSLFYWTVALNLSRYGRYGRSPYLGLGNFPLSRWFFYSKPSLYAFWKASTILILAGLFGWWLAHIIWIKELDTFWVLVVMGMALVSATFYGNTFELQNYNAIGWVFFPLGLYGLITEKWVVAGLAWFFASFGSFTVVFMAGILSVVSTFSSLSIFPILAMLPAGLKLLTHFVPFIREGGLKHSLLDIMKGIGMGRLKVKYRRPVYFGLHGGPYYVLLCSQFCIATYLLTGHIPLLFLTGVIIYILNQTYIRFADIWSVYMLVFTLATAVVIQNANYWLLLSYWILVSPLPRLPGFKELAGLSYENYVSYIFPLVPKHGPFLVKPCLEGMESFLSPVRKGQRVLMAFDDPKSEYFNIFDGHRVLLELPLYVSAIKEIHFMPDWHGVFQTNYEGAPNFWGRDIDSVMKNIEQWKVDYIVVYQDGGTEIEEKWKKAGFKVLSSFRWADYTPWARTWWLLKKPMSASFLDPK